MTAKAHFLKFLELSGLERTENTTVPLKRKEFTIATDRMNTDITVSIGPGDGYLKFYSSYVFGRNGNFLYHSTFQH